MHEDKHRNSPYTVHIYITFQTSAQRIVKRPDIVYTASRNKNRSGAQRVYVIIYWWFILIYDMPRARRDFLAFSRIRYHSYVIYYYRRYLLFIIFIFTVSLSNICRNLLHSDNIIYCWRPYNRRLLIRFVFCAFEK